MIAALEPWHLISLVLRMRESDARELEAFGFPADPVSRQRWACRMSLECLAGVAALDTQGRPLAAFGVRQGASTRVAVAFLIATDGWRAVLKDGIRAWRKFVHLGDWTRIEATCLAEVPENARLLQHMGFRFVDKMDAVREDGGDVLLYSLRPTHEQITGGKPDRADEVLADDRKSTEEGGG